MCWYSADHAEQMLEAEAGQRLVIRKIYGSSWTVSESDTQKARPTPVCLVDRTRVLFRFSGHEQPNLSSAPESEAVFRMLRNPKRDIFQFSDGREVDVNSLPTNLVFDVLEVPGSEQLSGLLGDDRERIEDSVRSEKRQSLRERVLALF